MDDELGYVHEQCNEVKAKIVSVYAGCVRATRCAPKYGEAHGAMSW